MTELILAKILVGSALVGWFFTSVFYYFRGDYDTRRDVVMSILSGAIITLCIGALILIVGGAIGFLLS